MCVCFNNGSGNFPSSLYVGTDTRSPLQFLYERNHTACVPFQLASSLSIIMLRFIHVVIEIESSLFLLLNYTELYGYTTIAYPFTCRWIFGFSIVGLLQIRLVWISVYNTLFTYMFPYLLGKYLRVLGHRVGVCLTLNFLRHS